MVENSAFGKAFISAGHSNTDPGACANGVRESDIVLGFRNTLDFVLSARGINFDADAYGDENLPLAQTLKIMRDKKPAYSVALEFHCNASANASATGVEVLAGPANMKRAAQLSRMISDALKIRDRGAKPENAGQHSRLGFVREGGMIVELFFISNRADLAAYTERKWDAARAVANFIDLVTTQ